MTPRASLIAAALATIATAYPAMAQQPAAPKPPGGVAMVNIVKGKAVVLNVNPSIRNVTVLINGELHNYTLSDSMKGIMNIKQGDTLNLEIVQELAVYLKKDSATAAAVGTEAAMMQLKPAGKPAMERVKVNDIKGTIASVNYATREVGITGTTTGKTMTIVADSSLHDLHAFKVGDHVIMRYTQGIVVAIANK